MWPGRKDHKVSKDVDSIMERSKAKFLVEAQIFTLLPSIGMLKPH